MTNDHTYTIFQDQQRLSTGDLTQTLTYLKNQNLSGALIFDDQAGRWVDFDLSGTLADVLAREVPKLDPPKAGPGRPKLGVIAREVTLLPRHWEWLEEQSGGASAALRRLIDEARKRDPEGERIRRAQTVTDRFLTVFGNLPGYEEATRALYARDQAAFMTHTTDWPEHVRAHALNLAAPAFASESV